MTQYDILEFLTKHKGQKFTLTEIALNIGDANPRITSRKIRVLVNKWEMVSMEELQQAKGRAIPIYYVGEGEEE